MKKSRIFLSALFVTLLFCFAAQAHPGPLDARGGHIDQKTGKYHYHNDDRQPNVSRKPAPKRAPGFNAVANGLYYVRVVRVIDASTIEVAFDAVNKERVNLIGVNVPAASTRNGRAAFEFAKDVLEDKKIWIQVGTTARDKQRRLHAYVWTEKPNHAENEREVRRYMFNARLLLDGYGEVSTSHPNQRYANMFEKFEREARSERRGSRR